MGPPPRITIPKNEFLEAGSLVGGEGTVVAVDEAAPFRSQYGRIRTQSSLR